MNEIQTVLNKIRELDSGMFVLLRDVRKVILELNILSQHPNPYSVLKSQSQNLSMNPYDEFIDFTMWRYFNKTNLISYLDGEYVIYSQSKLYHVNKEGEVITTSDDKFNLTLVTSIIYNGDTLFCFDEDADYDLGVIEKITPLVSQVDSVISSMQLIGI